MNTGAIVFGISSALVFVDGDAAHKISLATGILGGVLPYFFCLLSHGLVLAGLFFCLGSFFELESNYWRTLPWADMGTLL